MDDPTAVHVRPKVYFQTGPKHRAKEQYVFFLNRVMILLTLHSIS